MMTDFKGVDLKLLLPRLTYDGGDDGHGKASRKLSWLFHRSVKARLRRDAKKYFEREWLRALSNPVNVISSRTSTG